VTSEPPPGSMSTEPCAPAAPPPSTTPSPSPTCSPPTAAWPRRR
jgi:hypothetical protein